jgi:hypothetical protein
MKSTRAAILAAAVAATATFGLEITTVQAATPLAWSMAGGNLNACSFAGQCAGDNRRKLAEQFNFGHSQNNSLSLSDPTFGSLSVTTAPGEGQFALPVLKVTANGAANALGGNNINGEYASTLAFADGVQRYRWNGAEAIDLAVSTFVGSLHFANTGLGYVQAELNIIDSTLDDSVANGDYWYFNNAFRLGSPRPTCGGPGAIALASTGTLTAAQGETNRTLTPTCGAATFRLDPGEEFFVWARLDLRHLGAGATDASHTFSVGLSPDLTPETVQALSGNLRVIPRYVPGGAIPEPSTWALLIGGFGMAGAALRRRRGSRSAP